MFGLYLEEFQALNANFSLHQPTFISLMSLKRCSSSVNHCGCILTANNPSPRGAAALTMNRNVCWVSLQTYRTERGCVCVNLCVCFITFPFCFVFFFLCFSLPPPVQAWRRLNDLLFHSVWDWLCNSSSDLISHLVGVSDMDTVEWHCVGNSTSGGVTGAKTTDLLIYLHGGQNHSWLIQVGIYLHPCESEFTT